MKRQIPDPGEYTPALPLGKEEARLNSILKEIKYVLNDPNRSKAQKLIEIELYAHELKHPCSVS